MKTRALYAVLLCSCLSVTGAMALAQGRGPGGGSPGGGSPPGGGNGPGSGQPGGGGPFGQPHANYPNNGPNGPSPNGRGSTTGTGPNGTNSTTRGGLQLGPPGRWWDDKDFAKSLGLSKEQQRKMDAAFNMSKGSIVDSYKTLKKEESRLEKLTKEPKPDEAQIFAAIDSVAQARTALEKANAHMLLLVRQQMDAEQITRMDKLRGQKSDD
jgi:Spy/CpxP family protein refolding chaperone